MWRRSTIRLFLLVAVTVASIHFEGDLSLQASFAIVAVIACSWSWTDNAIQPAFSPHQISLEPRIGLMLIDLGFMDDAQWKALFVPEKESDPWSGLTLAKSGREQLYFHLRLPENDRSVGQPNSTIRVPLGVRVNSGISRTVLSLSPRVFLRFGESGKGEILRTKLVHDRGHIYQDP
jgi:hypothetical protein